MAHKRNNRRYNKLFSNVNRYFDTGGYTTDNPTTFGEPTENPGLTVDLMTPKEFSLGGLAGQAMDALKGGSAGVKGAVAALGNMSGSAIAGGLESGAGKAVNAVVGTVGKILPGPAGAIASAAAGVLGGLTNRMFGSKLNKENIEAAKNAIAGVNTTATASSLDTLTSNWGNTASLASFNKDYIGKDGWFANKAGKIYADLKRKTDIANARQDLALTTNYENIVGDTMRNLNSGYYAYGGPIGFGDGAIGYDFANRYLEAKELAAMGNDNPLTALPNMTGYGEKKAFGGELNTQGADFTNGLLFIENGGSHESNPYEGVQLGIDPEGVPNLVEEGETVFNDYVFSNRLKVPKAVRQKYKLGGIKSLTFADASKKLAKESEERPNDPISQRGLISMMNDLAQTQEQMREKENKGNKYARGGKKGTLYDGTGTQTNSLLTEDKTIPWSPSFNYTQPYPILVNQGDALERELKLTVPAEYTKSLKEKVRDFLRWGKPTKKVEEEKEDPEYEELPTDLRYAPAVAQGIATLTDALGITNKPDYSNAEAILSTTRGSGWQPVRFSPIGNYLTYKPFDRDYYLNKMNAEAGATRRSLINTSGGNRNTAIASLLAANNNYLNQIGALGRKADEYNMALRQQVEDFNRGTNTTNAQGFLQADMANQKAYADARDFMLKGTMAGAELREKARLMSDAAKSANLSGFVTSLGDIGRENMAWNWRNYGLATGTWADAGINPYAYLLGNAGQKSQNTEASSNKSNKGGKIKRKKKGLTV